MQIHQLNMKFSAQEDRILFRLSTHAKEELRFYLTRRFVKLMLPLVQEQLENLAITDTGSASVTTKKAMFDFHHESALDESNLAKKYIADEQYTLPLGDSPVLLISFGLQAESVDNIVMNFATVDSKGIKFTLNAKLLHSFYHLLLQTIKTAQWELVVAGLHSPQAKNKLN